MGGLRSLHSEIGLYRARFGAWPADFAELQAAGYAHGFIVDAGSLFAKSPAEPRLGAVLALHSSPQGSVRRTRTRSATPSGIGGSWTVLAAGPDSAYRDFAINEAGPSLLGRGSSEAVQSVARYGSRSRPAPPFSARRVHYSLSALAADIRSTMKELLWLSLALGFLLQCPELARANAPRLKVSDNQRYLMYESGKPFFYLGDTAWELFHRLNREEADLYLANRASKGFTVIQAVALAEQDGLNTPNPYGHRPLIENDPARPDVRPGPR